MQNIGLAVRCLLYCGGGVADRDVVHPGRRHKEHATNEPYEPGLPITGVAINIFRQPEEGTAWPTQPLGSLADATLVVLSIGLLVFGIVPSPLMQVIQGVVAHLGS
jgi:hypothetical protein